jgi:hypothetical protein
LWYTLILILVLFLTQLCFWTSLFFCCIVVCDNNWWRRKGGAINTHTHTFFCYIKHFFEENKYFWKLWLFVYFYYHYDDYGVTSEIM